MRFPKILHLTLALALICTLYVPMTFAAETKLTASDAEESDAFGWRVSIDGDYAVIGAYYENNFTGAAYVFYNNAGTWEEDAKLTASDGAEVDYFGGSVSISGNYIIVGAYGDNSAYVFYNNAGTWEEQDKLTPSTGGDFGFSVSIDGNYALIGDWFAESKGAAYVFYNNAGTWEEDAKLTASDRADGDEFGRSVSIDGDYALVGSNNDDTSKGSAYVFVKPGGGWSNMTQTAKLTASDGASFDYFGYSVSISGDYAIIGANGDDDNGDGSGSAYVFAKPGGGWSNMTQTAKLTASDGAEGDDFGISVSIAGNYALIGADADNNGTGAAYVFYNNAGTWGEQDKLTASDGAEGDGFGTSVSISGTTAIIGSPYTASMRGAAYINTNVDGGGGCGGSGGLSDFLCVNLTVEEAINISVDDTVISPTIVPGATTSPDAVGGDNKTIVTIDSNDPQGVTITISSKDIDNTADRFCFEDSGNVGHCTDPVEVMTTNGADGGTAAWLKVTTANGTTTDKTHQTDAKVNGTVTIFESTDALIEDDTFDVTYDFYANYGLKAQLYEGSITYTITGKV